MVFFGAIVFTVTSPSFYVQCIVCLRHFRDFKGTGTFPHTKHMNQNNLNISELDFEFTPLLMINKTNIKQNYNKEINNTVVTIIPTV